MTKADELLARIAAEDEALMTDRQRAAANKRSASDIKQALRQKGDSVEFSGSAAAEPKKPAANLMARRKWGMDKDEPKPHMIKSSTPLANWPLETRSHNKYKMSKTYQEITPESAENGEPSDSGFEWENRGYDSLWDMAKEMRDEGAREESGAGDWYTDSHTSDYHTATETSYGFHTKDLTAEQIKHIDAYLEAPEAYFQAAEPADEE